MTASSVVLADLNPAQVEAVTQPLSAITRVVAGPGSGKTRVLTCRIAYLLQEDSQNRVLGVTFTRKAAGEMQSRLEKLLIQQQQFQEQERSQLQQAPSNDQDDYGDNGDTIVQEHVGEARHTVGLDRVTLGTFHSICAKIMRWNGEVLGTLPSVTADMVGSQNATFLDGNFAIVDQGEQLRILKECLTEAEVDLKDYDLKPFAVLNAISDVKAKKAAGQDPFLANNNKKQLPKALRVAGKVYTFYREKLLATNCIDFDDLIYMTRELLLEHEEVRDRLQRRWTHVLVDEFQDTSRSQMDLIKFLTSSSLFIVGDADQSIYSWRGAHVGSLSDFANEFEGYLGGVHTVYLMENYRSTSNIVNAAQKVISASSGKSSTGADKLRQNMKPKRGSGPTPRVVACKDEKAECKYLEFAGYPRANALVHSPCSPLRLLKTTAAEFVVKHVKELVTSGKYGPENSVAFIYRTNAQSRALEEACVTHNLPYVIFGSATSFYKRQEIKDCLCFLRWMYNGRDRSAMLRSMKTPSRGLGDVAVREFDDYCARVDAYFEANHLASRKPSPFDVLLSFSSEKSLSGGFPSPSDSLSTRPLKLLSAFSHQMRSVRDAAYTQPVKGILTLIIEKLELVPHFDKLSKSKAEFEERQANVRELRKASERYTKNGPCLLRNDDIVQDADEEFTQSPLGIFLDDVSLVTEMAGDSEKSGEERFVASLMTIHASKGMEFDAVFIVGNEDGTFPTSQALNEGEGSVVLEEEKRLCYVAMTRAKTELFLSWRREVNIFTSEGVRTVDKERSRFLDVLVSSKGKPNSGSKPAVGTRSSGRSLRDRTNVYSAQTRRKKTETGGQQKRFQSASSWQRRADIDKSYALPRRKVSFEGTASVYAKRAPSPLEQPVHTPVSDRTVSTTRRPQNPVQKAVVSKAVPNKAVVSKAVPNKAIVRKDPESWAPPSNSNPRPSTKAAITPPSRQSMDSTWFFPVGSEVSNDKHGRGIVLNPPQARETGELPVLVKFTSGERHEFCARGLDLTPVVPE